MAEPIDTTEAGPPPAARPTRGTTRLSRVSAGLAWFVAVWFVLYGAGYLPLLVAGGLMVWLGIGAWQGRRRRTIALAALSTAAAIYYPVAAWWFWNHNSGLDGRTRYPSLWAAILTIQSAVLLAIALTALLSLRRSSVVRTLKPSSEA